MKKHDYDYYDAMNLVYEDPISTLYPPSPENLRIRQEIEKAARILCGEC